MAIDFKPDWNQPMFWFSILPSVAIVATPILNAFVVDIGLTYVTYITSGLAIFQSFILKYLSKAQKNKTVIMEDRQNQVQDRIQDHTAFGSDYQNKRYS